MALSIDGDALKDLRRANGWTLRAFATDAQISHGYLSRLERNMQEASPEMMWQIANALGVPLAAITGDKRAFTAAKNAALREPKAPRVQAVA